jgi:protease-4
MWKFLLGILVGIIVTVVCSFVIFFAIARLFATKQPSVAQNSVLVLNLSGDIPEAAPIEVPIPLLESQATPTIRDIWTSLHQASKDSRIKAVLIKPRGLAAGWAKLQELHQDLEDFKHSGKPVYAFLQSPGSREYYLASAAEKIYLSPGDSLDIKGFMIEQLFFKDALDKLGIQMQVDHIGRFKDAGDVFTRTNMSPETREVLNQVLDQIFGDFAATIGAGRRKSAQDVKNLIDNGPFLAPDAKAAGLIDALGYEDAAYADLKQRIGLHNVNRTPITTYSRAEPGQGDRIAVLVGQGDIVSGDPGNNIGNDNVIASGAFIKLVQSVRSDSSIKGVIVRVDSPGGDALASEEILHELKLLSRVKPVVISMSDLAASGGYLMSMTGNTIIAYPNTITGSIGVLYVRPDVRGLLGKLGVGEGVITRGRMADIDSITVPLSDAEKQKLHESIQATYREFVTFVAEARKKNYGQVDQLAQGRVWMGAQAQQNGLVDQLGGLDQAVTLIRKKANLRATGETNLVLYPRRRSLLEVLAESSPSAFETAAAEERVRRLLPALPSSGLLRGGVEAIFPYQVLVH